MKFFLEKFFCGASPEEIDMLIEKNSPSHANHGLSEENIKSKVFEKTGTSEVEFPKNPLPKKRKLTWKSSASLTAAVLALVLIIGTVMYATAYVPPEYEDAVMSASELKSIYDDTHATFGATSTYKEFFVDDASQLHIYLPEKSDTLPIYKWEFPDNYSEDEEYLAGYEAFYNSYHAKAVSFTGSDNLLDRQKYHFGSSKNMIYLYRDSKDERENPLSPYNSDETIMAQLKSVLDSFNTVFEKNFDGMYTNISYYEDVASLSVYFYEKDKLFPDESLPIRYRMKEYLCLHFYESGDYSAKTLPESIFLSDVIYYEEKSFFRDRFLSAENAKMLSVKEAEELLEQGFVFGGAKCFCRRKQKPINFKNHDYVSLEYIPLRTDGNVKLIPFYAFYKYNGQNEYGKTSYACVYVPAIQLSGLKEIQHRHNSFSFFNLFG